MNAKIIDGNELEQREQMRKVAIANMAMELAKGYATSGLDLPATIVAERSLVIATKIFDSQLPRPRLDA